VSPNSGEKTARNSRKKEIIAMNKLSKRAKEMKPSATLAMAARAASMRADGIDIISFATGEPDFTTPMAICNVAKKGIDDGLSHYTPSAGIPELKKAICKKLARDNGLEYAENEVTVTSGAKQAIFNALQVMIDPGDEVIIPAPYWVSYPTQVRLAGGTPVIISASADENFKISPDELRANITERTKAIILCSPSNPSGSAYTRDELAAIGELLSENEIGIISDEIYEKLVYDNFKHVSIVKACPAVREHTVVINGVSKAYAMTGWRMGFAAGPSEIISKMTMLTGQQTTCLPAFVQKACAAALDGIVDDEIESMRCEFSKRRNLMLEKLSNIDGISCHTPEGAFYLFPKVNEYFGKKFGERPINTAKDLAELLLEEGHIAVVSGEPFGAPEHIRLSYATSEENIKEGVRRFSNILKQLS
jgi:aspartate aminotransferase